MADESDPGKNQAMGKASDMYNDVVAQAGPGMAANACVLLAIGIGVGSLFNFLSLPSGHFSYSFISSFGSALFVPCGLVIVAGILICRVVTGDIKPLNKKTVLSLLGIVGVVEGLVLLIAAIVALTIDASFGDKVGTFIMTACWAVFVLAAALWATAEARKA